MYPSTFLIHSVTLTSRKRNFTLGYDNGTAVFTAGKTLTGATSHATAIIVSTGSAASGTLTLHTVSGTFQDNEDLSDNGTVPGAAKANGVVAGAVNTNEELTYTTTATTVSCRFGYATEIRRGDPGMYVSTPRVVLPQGTTVSEGDTIVSTTTGFYGSFKILNIKQVYEPATATVSHISCEIVAITATGSAGSV
jgi:hypothetical protein